MGIKGLSKFLKTNYSKLFELIHISEYKYQKVAVDTSLFMYHYKAIFGDEWLGAFVKLVSCLRENEVHCVFIYDSGCPEEKIEERKKRAESREKIEEKLFKLEEALEKFHLLSEIDPILVEFQKQKKIKSSMMGRGLNINAIEYAVKKLAKQVFTVSKQDFDTTKELFKLMNVPYFDAKVEAETMCADLCRQGKVCAVLSEDTDVIAYGAPVFLSKINVLDGTCIRVKYDQLLSEMELSSSEFLDFCIMCGTDYNKNIFRIGPAKAMAYINEYKSIDNISEHTKLDVSILNHKRGRELFTKYEKSVVKIPYCGVPKWTELSIFLTKKNIRVHIESLKKSFVRPVIFSTE